MNINLIKEDISKHLGSKIHIRVNGLRNKTNFYTGQIVELYPNIFVVLIDGEKKSFSYSEIISGEININYI